MSHIDRDACMPWDKCTSSSLLLLLVFLSCLIETIPGNYIIDCMSRIQATCCVSLAMWVTVPWHVPWRLYTWASVNALLSFSFHLLLTISLWLLQQMIKTVDFAPGTPGRFSPSYLRRWDQTIPWPIPPCRKASVTLSLSVFLSLYRRNGHHSLHLEKENKMEKQAPMPSPLFPVSLILLSFWLAEFFSVFCSSLRREHLFLLPYTSLSATRLPSVWLASFLTVPKARKKATVCERESSHDSLQPSSCSLFTLRSHCNNFLHSLSLSLSYVTRLIQSNPNSQMEVTVVN